MVENGAAPPSTNGVRKTITVPMKAAGWGGGIAAALLAIQPLTAMFMTNDKAETMKVQILELRDNQKEIKAFIKDSHNELTAQIRHGNDLILQTIRDSESRNVHNTDKLEKRLDRSEGKMDRFEASVNNKLPRR